MSGRITGRDKITGNFYTYFNLVGEDGLPRNVDLERVKFRRIQEEEAFMVLIPDPRKLQNINEVDSVEHRKSEQDWWQEGLRRGSG